MKFKWSKNNVTVVKESKDRKYYNDSNLFYAIKKNLIQIGYDVIKKEMVKDGHLVSECVYYIRQRKGKFAIWDSMYQVRNTYTEFNNGSVILNLAGALQG